MTNRMKFLGMLLGLMSVLALAGLTVTARDQPPQRPRPGVEMPTRGLSLFVELGLKDAEATGWGGQIKLTQGTVVALRVAGKRLQAGANQWDGQSRVTKKKAKKKATTEVNPLRVHMTLDAPLDATATITTARGEFSFRLNDIPTSGGKLFDDGQVRVTRGPLSLSIVDADGENDFPAAAVAPDGTIWVAYVSYKSGKAAKVPNDEAIPDDWSSLVPKHNGDQVKLVRFDGRAWSEPIDASGPGLDVWRPAVAAHDDGVTVAWSQNVDGDWDLHHRTYDARGGTWSEIERLERPGTDINPALVSRPAGKGVWAVWQGWAEDNFDILVQHELRGRVAVPLQIRTPANEWHPSADADSKGTLLVAYDTYQNGNYDVMLDRITVSAPAPNELKAETRTTPVADTQRFEARPSIAVDAHDRVWIAYEEAGANWGKDFGTRWPGPSGVPFYVERRIAVRVITDGRVEQPAGEIPAAAIETRYPAGRHVRASYPRLALDGGGRPWLLYRRHPLANGNREQWVSFATYHCGERWSEAVELPNSANLIDNRPALARLASGDLVAIHSTDSRARATEGSLDNDLYVSLLSAGSSSPESTVVEVAAETDAAGYKPVHSNEATDVARMRDYRIEAGGKTYRLLRGEFHRHTEISSHRDQDGPLEEIWRYGLDVARMDWIGSGDHDNGVREYPWWLTQKQTDIYHHAPVFIPMFTHERSVPYPSGHRNVMFATRGIRPLPRLRGDLRMGTAEAGSPDIKRLYAYLKHFGGICSSHTSATNMGTDWRDNDPEAEPVVEIYQGHRQNYEHKGAPQSAKDGPDSIGGYREAGYVWNALQRGYRLGTQVSSDHISTHLSYAIVLAEEATRRGIIGAFKKRHSYGAQDNIVLVVKCGEHLMGDDFAVSAPPQFEITAVGTAPVARVVIVRGVGGEPPTYVYTAEPNAAEISLRWTDETAVAAQTSYYYVRLEQADGKLAWASPMWVRYEK